MLIDLKVLISIVIGIFTIGGGIVGFFVMQAKQNMRLEHMEEQHEESKKKLSEQSKYQIQTEKNIIEINGKISQVDDKMDMILIMMKELKDRGCGRCSDKM